MKQKFSKSWSSSVQPRKQIKFRANAPIHIKRKFMSSTLDKPLRKKYSRRSIEIKLGDEIKIMRGKYKKKTGKVSLVDIKNSRIQIEGMQITKKSGEKVNSWFNPSKVKIISLNENDSRRFKDKKISKEEKQEIKKEQKNDNKMTNNKLKEKKIK